MPGHGGGARGWDVVGGLGVPGWGRGFGVARTGQWIRLYWDRLVSLGVPGWDGGFGGAELRQWVGGCRLGPLTAELLLEEFEELCPAQGVSEELAEVEAPPLHTQLGGGQHPAGDTAWGLAAGSPQLPAPPRAPSCGLGYWVSAAPTGRLRGGVHGPVRGVVRDPGVAGQAAGHDGVVGHVLLVELDVPARSGGWRRPRPPSHCCHQPRAVTGTCSGPRLRSLPQVPAAGRGDAGAPVTPTGTCPRPGQPLATHPSRQMDDFTLVLAMAFLQYSIWGRPRGQTSGGPGSLCPPGAAPTPHPSHLPLVVIHVLGL